MIINGGFVLSMLCPEVEWTITENDYDSINWFGKEPAVTKEQFEAGFAQYPIWKANQIAQKEATRKAILEKLGLTPEEVAVLLA